MCHKCTLNIYTKKFCRLVSSFFTFESLFSFSLSSLLQTTMTKGRKDTAEPSGSDGKKDVKKEKKPKDKQRDESPDYKWVNSLARKLLHDDIVGRRIPLEDDGSMTTEEIFHQRPEYTASGWKRFPKRLQALRQQIKREETRATKDEAYFQNYISNHPPSETTGKGYIEWEGSQAQVLLNTDIDNGLHTTMKPKELWKLHDEYQEFPLKVFADHIKQEVGTRKYKHTLKERGRKKGLPLPNKKKN